MNKKNTSYQIFYVPGKEKNISNGDYLRIDLYDNFKMREITELKGFNYIYVTKGHNWKSNNKGIDIPAKTRYIQVFKK